MTMFPKQCHRFRGESSRATGNLEGIEQERKRPATCEELECMDSLLKAKHHQIGAGLIANITVSLECVNFYEHTVFMPFRGDPEFFVCVCVWLLFRCAGAFILLYFGGKSKAKSCATMDSYWSVPRCDKRAIERKYAQIWQLFLSGCSVSVAEMCARYCLAVLDFVMACGY